MTGEPLPVADDEVEPVVFSTLVYPLRGRPKVLTLQHEKSWRRLKESFAEHPAKRMLWEGPPLDETRKKLQGLGIDIVAYDPCGNKPGAGDFLEVMRGNANQLREILTL